MSCCCHRTAPSLPSCTQARASVPALRCRNHAFPGFWSQLSFPLQTRAASGPHPYHRQLKLHPGGKQRERGSVPRLQSGREAEPPSQGSVLREHLGSRGAHSARGAGRSWGTRLSAAVGFPSLGIRSSIRSPGTLFNSSKPIRCLNN